MNPDNSQKNLFETSKKVEEVKMEIKQEVKQEAKQEAKQEVKQEVKQEAKQEVKQEVKQSCSKSDGCWVENLNCQKTISSTFVVSDKNIKTSANGRDYITLTLGDRTGLIDGRIFPDEDVNNIYDTIVTGSICKLEGRVNEFPPESGKFNVVINHIVQLSEEKYVLEDYIRTSSNDAEEMAGYILSTIREIKNTELKNLLESFFSDEEFTRKFYNAPAARFYHHNYLSGLLDHTVDVLKISKTQHELFPEIDEDLLYAGALLHDIGKIKTYDYDNLSINMSEEGQILDHLSLSAMMVKKKLEELNISKNTSNQLLHIILSHHGNVSNGWGSTVDPKTPEAVALHYADLLDARVKNILNK